MVSVFYRQKKSRSEPIFLHVKLKQNVQDILDSSALCLYTTNSFSYIISENLVKNVNK